jgi:hypothetical protein
MSATLTREKMHLYKFREVNINNLTSLAKNQLWFSSLNDLNDPFEGCHIKDNNIDPELSSGSKLKPKNDVNEHQYQEILNKLNLTKGEFTSKELFQRLAETDFDIFIKIVHDSKVVCFSIEQEENNPLTNNLMWSHYANGLRGYCLVFNEEDLLKDIDSSTSEATRSIIVKYQDHPNIIKLNDFIQSEVLPSDECMDFVEKVTETAATKSSDWKYENEFRIMSLSKSNVHCYSPSTLKEIIVGDKMPSAEKSLLLSVVKGANPNIIIKTARLKSNT